MRTTTSLLALVLVLPTSAGAATIRVPEDYATIYEAVDAAAAGDSVVVGPGTWTERDTRTVTMNGFSVTARAHAFLKPFLTVVGSGLDATILQGDEPAPGIGNLVLAYPDSYPGGLVTITGLTLRGVAGGDYLGYQGTGHGIVALEGCLVENHLSGIVMDNADLVMRNCIVRENHGNEHFAAAIQARSVDVDLEDCLFEGNVGENFGVVYNACVGLCGTTIRNCRFVANESPRVVLLTNQRPLEFEGCWFEGNVSSGTGGTCLLAGNCDGIIVGNTFANNVMTSTGSGVLSMGGLYASDIVNNTVYGTVAPMGSSCSGIVFGADDQVPHQFRGNIVAGCSGGPAVKRGPVDFNPTDGCNVFWDNDSGDFVNYVPQPTDVHIDPMFCDAPNLDFTLSAFSPCLPGGIPTCGLIGAWDQGCGVISVSQRSWGEIKSLYRTEE